MLEVDCANLQTTHAIDEGRLAEGVRRVLETSGITHGEISLTVVDDVRMHELNRKHLNHDYPTDVLSFLLDRQGDYLEGEVIVSADYAAAEATRYGWAFDNELLLYVVHGALHLVGYDDTTPSVAEKMRAAERAILGTFGLSPPNR
jgi:probable rRNA maturation factor